MELEGWNSIPDGYGASFDTKAAPLWLRLWFNTPLVDRFAYPVMVQRGFGYLTPMPGHNLGSVRKGWKVNPAGTNPPEAEQNLGPR
jgi:hypothetical protein